MTSSPARTRFALVALVVCVPYAAAQTLTPPELPQPGAGTTPLPGTPSDLPTLDVLEEGFAFQGTLVSPTHILLTDADGAPVFEYQVHEDGRATVYAGDEPLLEDATLLRVDGDPLSDAFTLVLQDAEGRPHAFEVDRAALREAPLPSDLPLPETPAPTVEAVRPPGWPFAPEESYLLFLEDAGRNRLGASSLDGSPYVRRTGTQAAVVQIPLGEMKWDAALLQVGRAGEVDATNFSFVRSRDTDTAAIFLASFDLASLAPRDGDTMELRVIYEKRLTPFVVERLPEPATYQVRVDGAAPSVTLSAPASSDDFRIPVAWNGADAHAGIGGFKIESRPVGASSWTVWLADTTAKGATFQGDWGKTYEFRATALDKVGNPSRDPATARTEVVAQPTGEDDVNDPPTARFLAPEAGSVAAGAVTIRWEASDPDQAPVSSRLQVSDDNGVTWRTLFAGTGTSAVWDTLSEADGGGYRLRLTVSDGSQSAQDIVSGLTVRNVVEALSAEPGSELPGAPSRPAASPSAPAPSGSAPAAPAGGDAASEGDGLAPAADAEGNDTPLPAAVVLVAAGIAAMVVARRRR